ncbi:MAG: phosphoglycerate dehydrogenase [Planctomycetes bacterium]|nr:phosphoglycerate dehydrogenase [Planctomycetota bacterium]
MKVLVSDSLAEEGLRLLRDAKSIEVDVRTGLAKYALKPALTQADGIIIRSGTQLTAEVLDQPGKLRAIVRAGVGVDNIDVPTATRRGIVVMNTPGGNTVSTAEHTISLMMALSRNIPQANESLHAGRWDRGKFTGAQLAGKTLGVVGLGRVGMAVAKRALAMEMKVLGFDPFLSPERAAEQGVETVKHLDDLLTRCDFLTVHTPLSDETRGLIGAERIAKMRRGVRIINCARGGIIDEKALEDALRSGHVAGAALDVFEQEPPGEHPLLKLPNVIATPHLGASTAEAQVEVAIEAARLMIDFLTAGHVRFAVNMASIDRAELAELRLYLDMARRLGLLHAQMDRGAVRRVLLHYRGDVSKRNTKLVTACFAAGLLEHALVEGVNIVNAEVLAKERGIEIVEQKSTEQGDFTTMIHATVETEEKTYDAAGTLFGKQFLRLVRLGEFHLDAYLDGVLLIFSHQDVPGIIGSIGTIFGKHGVNIAAMTVGRERPGGQAIAVLNLDSEPPAQAVKEVLDHPKISSASVVKLPPAGEMPPWLL